MKSEKREDIFASKTEFKWRGASSLLGGFLIHLMLGNDYALLN
jgi:hypothetical protein